MNKAQKAEIIFRFYNDHLNDTKSIARKMNIQEYIVKDTISEYFKDKTEFITLESKLNYDNEN